jgi:quinol monooxygenase YgiN
VRRNLRRDRSSNEIDLVVYGEFDDTDALARYHADPRYQRAVERVRPRRELRFAADIEA